MLSKLPILIFYRLVFIYIEELDSLYPTSQKTPSGNANMWNKQEICDWLERNKIDR